MADEPLTIVSGGQTGVDRGALDAALEAGAPCGGWCPAGRRAEDGRIPDRYPLREHHDASYAARTRQNVLDSDATLIVYRRVAAGGTALTRALCRELERPVLSIDLETTTLDEAAQAVVGFLRRHAVAVLNVAGPRASQWPVGRGQSHALLARVLSASRRDQRAP